MLDRLKDICLSWFHERDGVAAMEAAMIFPILAILLIGTYDMGNAILAGQKSIRASQVTADLMSRESEVNNSMIDEAIWAGELALQPLDTTSYGVDVVSVGFDDSAVAFIEWRETRNMPPNPDVLNAVASLAEAGNGVMVVTIQYQYDPLFMGFSYGSFNVGVIPMREIAFSRGRKSAIVTRI